MKESVFVVVMIVVLFFAAFVFGFTLGWNICRDFQDAELIKRGVKAYNATSGKLEWVERKDTE